MVSGDESKISELVKDAAAVVGLVLITGGVAAIYWPAAMIVAGCGLLGGAIWGHARAT